MNDFDGGAQNHSNANCSKCGAAQNSTTIYCAKCGTVSLRGQSPIVALGLRSAMFFGMLIVIVGLGTLSGCFLLMITLKRSIYADSLLILGSAVAFTFAILCLGVLFRLRKL